MIQSACQRRRLIKRRSPWRCHDLRCAIRGGHQLHRQFGLGRGANVEPKRQSHASHARSRAISRATSTRSSRGIVGAPRHAATTQTRKPAWCSWCNLRLIRSSATRDPGPDAHFAFPGPWLGPTPNQERVALPHKIRGAPKDPLPSSSFSLLLLSFSSSSFSSLFFLFLFLLFLSLCFSRIRFESLEK